MEKILRVYREHKGPIAWSIVEIKSISPSICKHYIHIEDGNKSSTQPQWRLNPNMKEVVKQKVIKILDACIMYPILDSKWFSHKQVVPKKGGVTVVENSPQWVDSDKFGK